MPPISVDGRPCGPVKSKKAPTALSKDEIVDIAIKKLGIERSAATKLTKPVLCAAIVKGVVPKPKVGKVKAPPKAKVSKPKAPPKPKAEKAKPVAKPKVTKAKAPSKAKPATVKKAPAPKVAKPKVAKPKAEPKTKKAPVAKKPTTKLKFPKVPTKEPSPKKIAPKKTAPKRVAKPKADKSPKVKISPYPLPPRSPKPKTPVPKTTKGLGCIERSKLPLKEHQLRVVNHMRKHRGLIAAHAVGSGKTLTAVASTQCFLEDNPKDRVVIVTPVSLQDNFKKEMRAYGVDPDKDPRYEFHTLQGFAKTYARKTCGKDVMLVIDEAHNLRTEIKGPSKRRKLSGSPAGKISRAGVAVQCAKTAGKVLLLTATSIYNSPYDLANLVAMVKGVDPPTKKGFEKMMEDPDKAEQFFKCVLSFYDVPKTEEYPSFKEHYVNIEMTPKYYKLYHDVETKNSHLMDNKWRFLVGVRQASNSLEECLKCEWVLSRAKKGTKMVIYSAFRTFGVEKLQSEFKKAGIPYTEVTGSSKKGDRDRAVQKYNTNGVQILFITKAGGEGLDLKGTREIVILESSWNRPNEEQIIGRGVRFRSHAHLPPAERHVDVYHLMIVKPPGVLERFGDENPSADEALKMLIEEKEAINRPFLKMLYRLSIEQKMCGGAGHPVGKSPKRSPSPRPSPKSKSFFMDEVFRPVPVQIGRTERIYKGSLGSEITVGSVITHVKIKIDNIIVLITFIKGQKVHIIYPGVGFNLSPDAAPEFIKKDLTRRGLDSFVDSYIVKYLNASIKKAIRT